MTQEMPQNSLYSYPMTAMQEGMLFHSISRPASGVDIEQIVFNLNESLDVDLFVRSWVKIVERYPVLRTRFVSDMLDNMVQQVVPDFTCNPDIMDWSNLEKDEQERRFTGLQKADRLKDFDLSSGPPFRLAIIQLGQDRFRCLWTFHHAILDGRSFPIILTDVFDIYESLLSGTPLDLPPIKPFSEYVEWQRRLDFDKSKTYWQQKLKGYVAPLAIGCKTHNEKDESFQVDAIEQCIDESTTKRLTELAQRQEVTLHTFLQAAWALVLHHYSGEDDIVYGSTRANRHATISGAENMVGLLINTVPIRTSIEDGISLKDFLTALRRQHIELREHEQTPLTKIRGWSDMAAGKPLFETLVVFENFLLNTRMKSKGGNWINREFSYHGQTNFPMTLVAYADSRLIVRLEFRLSHFEREFASAVLKHTCNLLEQFVTRLETPIKEIPYLDAVEKQILLDNSKALQSYNMVHQSVVERFSSIVLRHPEDIAVKFENSEFTYQQLERAANKIALELGKLGVKTGDLVGLCVDRSMHTVLGVLGILKAGAAYVPIDPEYPAEHLQYIIGDAGISVVVTSKQRQTKIKKGEIIYFLVDQIDIEKEARDENNDHGPDHDLTADHIAYVIYTSGSTGNPKGVLVTHRNVLRLFDSTNSLFAFDSSDVWTLFHSYAFDFSVWEIWGALLYGGKLVIVPFWITRSTEDFYLLLAQEGVTVLNQTPGAFRQLSNIESINGVSEALKLRYIIFGGEALDFVSLQPWFDRHGDQHPKLINMYGITETTVHVTYRRITASDAKDSRGSLIGKPIPDLSLYLLNEAMNPVPPGAPGEIYVGGGGVADGYLNREELTRERFIKNPFAGCDSNARLYKTGDLGRYEFDGELEYIGRSDLQVKIRGFRIELGEIESKLSAHPEIIENTVNVRKLTEGDSSIVAYYVCAGESRLAAEDVRIYLEQRLPQHMVPAAFMRLDNLPLTNNGKIDRAKLPKPVSARKSSSEFIAPETESERALQKIWEHLLDVQDIGIDDNFFNLGGDSIISIKLIVQARKQGMRFAPKDIFHSPTIRELARIACLNQRQKGGVDTPDPVEGAVELLPIQHWFFEQRLTGKDYWNQAFLFDCKEVIDIECLENALVNLVSLHDSLRLRYEEQNDKFLQAYSSGDISAPVDLVEIQQLSAQDISDEITRISIDLQGMLDITNGPIMRLAVFRADNEVGDSLLIAIHHLVVDGVSWQILMEDLEQFYLEAKNSKVVSLPNKTSSYKKWAARLNNFAQTASAENELKYWRALFVKSYANSLPADIEEYVDNTEISVETVSVSLTEAETDQLLTRANNAYNTRINDILILALVYTLNEWCESNAVLFDMEGHGREDIFDDMDLSRTVGWFTSIFPCLIHLEGQEDVGSDIIAVKEYLRAIPDNGLGFSLLKYLSRNSDVRNVVDSLPQGNVLFNYLGQLDLIVKDSMLFAHSKHSTGPWHHPDARRKYLLEINLFIKNKKLVGEWSYSKDIHRKADIETRAHGFIDRLKTIILHCTEKRDRVFTRSDFPLAQLEQHQYVEIRGRYENFSDIYPLSPMQNLYFSLTESTADIGVDQWYYTLKGDLDIERFRLAWEQVINLHSTLRSCFVSAPLDKPHQIVMENVELPWVYLDWRNKPLSEQKSEFDSYLESDRTAGFNIEQAPLTRITLVRVDENEFRVVWTHHHLQIDGWSWPLVMQDVAQHYSGQGGVKSGLGQPNGYKKYIAWINKPRKSAERSFWKNTLAGIPLDTAIPVSESPDFKSGSHKFAECQLIFDAQFSRDLQDRAINAGISLNTLFQAAWSVVLAAVNGGREVVFGASFSGRPVEIPDVESIVGPFVNTLPVRVSFSADQTLAEWLKSLNAYLLDIGEFQHSALTEIYDYADIPANKRLFESLVVFQNYQKRDAAERMGAEVEISDFNAPVRTHYPITVVANPGEQFKVNLIYETARINAADANRILDCVKDILEKITAESGETLTEVVSVATGYGFFQGSTDAVNAVAQYVAPKTDLEKSIAKVWRHVFELDNIGTQDDFFSLGGQSILMVKLHQLLEKELGTRLSIARLFQFPTIEKLAKYLDKGDSDFTDVQETQERASKQRMARKRQKNKRVRGK